MLLNVDWNFGDSKSRLRIELRPEDSGTLITLTNSTRATESAHWNTYGLGASGVGWEITLFGPGRYLSAARVSVQPGIG